MDIIIPLHSSFLFAVFKCLFGLYIFAVRSQVIKYDGDNFNLEIKKLGHYHQTAVTDFKYVENYFKSKKMCMLDIGNEDIPEKYKRIGMHMKASDFISRGLYHGKEKSYIAAYYLFLMALEVAKSITSKSKALANMGLALMRFGRQMCTEASFMQKNIESGQNLLMLGEEKFKQLIHFFPAKQAWAKEKIDICKSWLNHFCVNGNKKDKSFSWISNNKKIDVPLVASDSRHNNTSMHKSKQLYPNKDKVIAENGSVTYKTIHTLRYNSSMEPFHKVFSKLSEPIILKQSPVMQWPLFKKMSWRYLQNNLPHRINVKINNDNYDLYSHKKSPNDKKMLLNKVLEIFNKLDKINSSSLLNNKSNLVFPYLMTNVKVHGHNKQVKFKKEMIQDLLKTPYHGISFCGGEAGDFLNCRIEANLWVGARNVHAVSHYDSSYNSFVQIVGSKEFILAPPKSLKDMYIYPKSHPKHHRQSKITNLEDVNRTLFPNFDEETLYKVILNPGDVLVMPPYWFHQVKSLTSSIALNIWSQPSLFSIAESSLTDPVDDEFINTIEKFVPSDDKNWRLAIFLKLSKLFLLKAHDGNETEAFSFIQDVILEKYYPYEDELKVVLDDDQCVSAFSRNGVCPPVTFMDSMLPPAIILLNEEIETRIQSLFSEEIKRLDAFDILVANTVESFIIDGIELHYEEKKHQRFTLLTTILKCCLLKNTNQAQYFKK